MEPLEINPEVVQLAQSGDAVYQLPEFVSWMYAPLERIQPYIDRYWSNQDPFGMLSLSTRSRGRKYTRKKKSGIDLEALISEAISALIDNQWRALYEARLLRQCALYQIADRLEDVNLLRAVASVLNPDSGIPTQEQPFVRELMRISIEQGPFRVIAEALEAARLGNMPIDLFPGE